MNVDQIKRMQRELHDALGRGRVGYVVSRLIDVARERSWWEMRERVDELSMRYGLLSRYYMDGVEDSGRTTLFRGIVDDMHTLVDSAVIGLLSEVSREVFFERRRELGTTVLSELISRYRTESHKIELLKSLPDGERNVDAIVQARRQCEQLETDMFNKVWSCFPMSQGDSESLLSFCTDVSVPEYARGLLVMALLLGLTKYYDERKLLLFGRIYCGSGDSAEVQTRCVVGLLLGMRLHDVRCRESAHLPAVLSAMADEPDFSEDVAVATFLLVRSRNTDNISRRVHDELMPDLSKMSPDLRRKLRDSGGNPEALDLEENPQWREMIENDSFVQKMETFQRMQMEGNDVFLSTFSRLKSFPFFYTMSNWFLPYHSDHTMVEATFGEADNPLAEMVANAPFLCNSDRFSFCLSLGSIPVQQRDLMREQVRAHMEENREELSSNPTRANARYHREVLMNGCVQDLYRFFKLFSRRSEFAALMDMDMDMTRLAGLSRFTCTSQILSAIARFYMDNGFDTDALRYYTLLCSDSAEVEPIVQQRIGLLYERQGRPEQALRHYLNYELAVENSVWNLRHIASCYRALRRYDEALEYYRRADGLSADNVSITLSIGHCLLEAGRAEEALQQYFKADLLDDKRHRAWRPIAWCSFLTGNMERALDYYSRMIDHQMATSEDYLNRGHVLLCLGRRIEAVESYRQSIAENKGSVDDFLKAFDSDRKLLLEHGLNAIDLALVSDAATVPQTENPSIL